MNTRSALFVAFMAGLVAMTAGQAPILMTEPCNQLSIGEVADALNFTVLGDLLDATRLYNALNGTRYVLLAPTDTAFANALRATGLSVEKLLSRPDLVSQILTYHVVNSTNAPTFFANKTGSVNVTTLAGRAFANSNLTLSASGPNVTIRAGDNNATIPMPPPKGYSAYNSTRCGFQVYPIDSVLLPPGGLNLLTTLAKGAPAPAPKVVAKAPTPSVTSASAPPKA